MWMYKDGITRFVSDREAENFKNMGYKEVKPDDGKIQIDKDPKKPDDGKKNNGSSAQNKADAL